MGASSTERRLGQAEEQGHKAGGEAQGQAVQEEPHCGGVVVAAEGRSQGRDDNGGRQVG